MTEAVGPVLHVLGRDTLGGCERLTLDLAKYFAGLGVRQELVFLSPGDGPVGSQFRALGVETHCCAYQRNQRLRFVKRFAVLCQQRRISAVISHAFGLHFFIALGARLGGVQRFLALVGNPPPRELRVRLASTILCQAARPFVYREVACSNYVAREMERVYRLPRQRVAVVHNWCDVDMIRLEAEKARAERTDRGPVLGTVARLDPIKDHPTVIRAFALFRKQVPGASLRLIGDGPTWGLLQKLAEQLGVADDVNFVGVQQDVATQLGQLDLFVYGATKDEGFGIVLAEAMAAGTPILCTDVGPCAEVLDGGNAGYLVPPGNPNVLAQGMATLWRDDTLRESLMMRGHVLVNERYSMHSGGGQILSFLKTSDQQRCE